MTGIFLHLTNIIGNARSYPSWSTGKTYPLLVTENRKGVVVSYKTQQNKIVKRSFPKKLALSIRFCYVLGLVKGEGANALGKSNYRRFTMTNADPRVMNLVLTEFDKADLLKTSDIKDGSFHILHHIEKNADVIKYWSKKLNIAPEKFSVFNGEKQTSKFGVCHLYISDVLLRRVVDLLQDYVGSS